MSCKVSTLGDQSWEKSVFPFTKRELQLVHWKGENPCPFHSDSTMAVAYTGKLSIPEPSILPQSFLSISILKKQDYFRKPYGLPSKNIKRGLVVIQEPYLLSSMYRICQLTIAVTTCRPFWEMFPLSDQLSLPNEDIPHLTDSSFLQNPAKSGCLDPLH